MLGHQKSIVMTNWQMAITNFLCISTLYARTRPLHWIISSESFPYFLISQDQCYDNSRVENLSGKGFDLLWAGPNATNVPKEAVVVDNNNPGIVYYNTTQWSRADNVQFYSRSLSLTAAAGASLGYTFEGVAIWYGPMFIPKSMLDGLFHRYYGAVDIPHGLFTVSIDGSTPEQLNGKNSGGQLAQQMLWFRTGLKPGSHTFTLTQSDSNGAYLDLDFFRSVISGARRKGYHI
jgi:hypothetical protein